ncbi:hypothetical protein Aasi_1481 [Candidatus Amoebophilus asiaticus 5a2]|uniref:SRPBCC family protein n=2 Tax=Candidatus Amoebophilus asiaticus TaxID=281120 RepID=C3L4D4_AMOA5|nr:hypothetical protein Aasi_1481 [Candidatus Amoebophilus asiaticus 5a2]
MKELALELTHSVYPHDEIYGEYCTIEEYINCPPEKIFSYLADHYNLAEWTYSLRNFRPNENVPEQIVGNDVIGAHTKIYVKTISNRESMTVDYHCAWDQGEELWMIYLMRVVPAQTVLKKPGSVVLWTNCHHPYYDNNPFSETAPPSRPVWVGDLWPMFYAGHYIEMQNLKHILEYRHNQSKSS